MGEGVSAKGTRIEAPQEPREYGEGGEGLQPSPEIFFKFSALK